MNLSDFASGRTRGDGMEFVDITQSDRQTSVKTAAQSKNLIAHTNVESLTSRSSTIPGATSIYRCDDDSSRSVKLPVKVPQGKQFFLVPHLVNTTKKSCSLKTKAPKFVPFEPYKAAVSISEPFDTRQIGYFNLSIFIFPLKHEIRLIPWCLKRPQKSIA